MTIVTCWQQTKKRTNFFSFLSVNAVNVEDLSPTRFVHPLIFSYLLCDWVLIWSDDIVLSIHFLNYFSACHLTSRIITRNTLEEECKSVSLNLYGKGILTLWRTSLLWTSSATVSWAFGLGARDLKNSAKSPSPMYSKTIEGISVSFPTVKKVRKYASQMWISGKNWFRKNFLALRKAYLDSGRFPRVLRCLDGRNWTEFQFHARNRIVTQHWVHSWEL